MTTNVSHAVEPVGLTGVATPDDSSLRRKARERAITLGFPTAKTEGWKYTNLKSLGRDDLAIPGVSSPDPAILERWRFADAPLLVVVNGRCQASLSDAIPSGVTVSSSAEKPDLIERLDELDPFQDEKNPLAAWNAALHTDALFIDVASGADAGTLQVLFINTGGESASRRLTLPRLTVTLGESSRATIIETYASEGTVESVTIASTRASCASNAELHHIRIQSEGESADHYGIVRTSLARDSRLRQFAMTAGAITSRYDSTAVLQGEGADCEMNGLYVLDGEQRADHQTLIDHALPHGNSRQTFKGVLDGRSRGVYEGRIIVRPDAQKTNAAQSNDNLIVSDTAIANSTPQLEIYADDVKCRHGSTIGRLDEDSIFYIRSRGISEERAREILTRGFASEVVDLISSSAIRERIESILSERSGQ